MEAVLKLEYLSSFIVPWKQVVRGCLVVIFTCILYSSVQNYAEDMEEGVQAENAGYVNSVEDAVVDISAICEKTAALKIAEGPGKKEAAKRMGQDPVVVKNPIAVRKETTAAVAGIGFMETIDLSEPGNIDSVLMDPGDIRNQDMSFIPGISAGQGAAENLEISDSGITEESGMAEDPGSMNPVMIENPRITNPGITERPGLAGSEITEEPGAADPGLVGPELTDTEFTDSAITENPDKAEETDDAAAGEPTDEEVGPEVIGGFIIDSEGYITGCTEQLVIMDDLLMFPINDRCVGIRSGALDSVAAQITEIYIPANICGIEPGVFDLFSSLMYVEVSEDNPGCYSREGILYAASGEILADPAGR